MSFLELKDLSIGFQQKPLFSNLSLRIGSPAFVAIIGHNGCGKSTFFRSLIGKQQYSGKVIINGADIAENKKLLSSGLITLLEQKNSLSFNITVKDLVLMGRFRFKKLFQNYSKEDFESVAIALETLSISHLANEEFLKLSGGEQQLVWLAQVVVQDTEIILLDEPTQQMDVYNRKKIFDLMQHLAYEKGKIVVCITHDLSNLFEMKGYYLQLSRQDISMKNITPNNIQQEISFLEQQKINHYS